MYRNFGVVLVLFLCSACTAIHYGHTEAEWRLLSEEERLIAMKAFEKLEHDKYTLQHGDSRDNSTEAFKERALGSH
ncbi:hypothetical protein NBRC116493_11590 [Aurantivibrio infirmus]